jgi:hypothetical protein
MLPRFSCLLVALFALILAVTDGALPAGAIPAPSYVAFGDEFAQGIGAGEDYFCYHPTSAATDYPSLYGQHLQSAHPRQTYLNASCGLYDTGASYIESREGGLNAGAALSTITMGWDDIGMYGVAQQCATRLADSCLKAVSEAKVAALDTYPIEEPDPEAVDESLDFTLTGWLDRMYDPMRQDGHHTRILVMGYPVPYDLTGTIDCANGLSPASRAAVDQVVISLNQTIKAAAVADGLRFVDVTPYFAGHQICDPNRWIHGLQSTDLTGSWHPTAAGQRYGYLRAVEANALTQ